MSKLDELRSKVFPVLDQGWIRLAAAMGDDRTIIDRARGTTDTESKTEAEDRTLLRRMMRHHHGSSFEFPEIDIQFFCPFYVWRQVIRHRAGNMIDDASMWCEPSVNELSGRYSEVPDAIQLVPPGQWRRQSKSNRQGSDGFIPEVEGSGLTGLVNGLYGQIREVYGLLLGAGVAKEQARLVWPMAGYTQGFCKMDLRNWLSFSALRLAPDAQADTRAFAEVVAYEILRPLYPQTFQAFEDYVLNALTLSALDVDVARAIAGGISADVALLRIANRTEMRECRSKLVRLGIIPSPQQGG